MTKQAVCCRPEMERKQMFSFRRRGLGRLFSGRYKGYVFVAFTTVLFLHQGLYSGHNTHPDITLSPLGNKFNWDDLTTVYIFGGSDGVVTKHPIPKLMDSAEDKFRNKLQKQSKTLVAAVGEYQRRYKRHPPRGFDAWWAFAQKNHVRMVDEFDGLMHDLDPFRNLSGQEIRHRTLQASLMILFHSVLTPPQAGELPSIHLVRIRDGLSSTVKMNHAYEDSEVSARARGFLSMISDFVSDVRLTTA